MLIKSKIYPFLSHHSLNPSNLQSFRTFINNLELKFVADRGLDHAVEKEKDLKGVINLKNLLKCEPSKSLSLSSIVDNIENLEIPCRVIDFIRKYPCIFEEYFPANIAIHPHVRLTQESLNLDAEEQLIYSSDLFKNNAADRLLKLLMLCRFNQLPLRFIDLFKWDLGFPDNYVDLLVPKFPDYFRVRQPPPLTMVPQKWSNRKVNNNGFNRGDSLLELVCWSDELAVSAAEKRAMKEVVEYQKGMPIAFPLQFSTGFVMDKGLKKWVDEWQKLPYVSPYENALHFQPNSDMFDKWVVAVLHELLHIFVSKKTERENFLCFGEYLGIKPSVKRALAHHPGIFYRSSKIGTHTVVLREGYKRGLLIDKNPLIDLRNKYIHLMHKVKEVQKVKSVPSGKQQAVKEGVAEKGEDNANECEEANPLSDFDVNENSDDNDDDEEEEDEEQLGSSRAGRRFERRGSYEVIEGRRKPGEGRGRPRRNDQWDVRASNNKEECEGSRGGQQNGSRLSRKVLEDKRNPGERRGSPRKNVSWDLRRGENADERVKNSSGGHINGRRGPEKVYENMRKHGDSKGRPRRNSSRGESGDYDHKERVERSRGEHNYGSRGSGKLHDGRRAPGEGKRRPKRYGSQERSTQKFSTRT